MRHNANKPAPAPQQPAPAAFRYHLVVTSLGGSVNFQVVTDTQGVSYLELAQALVSLGQRFLQTPGQLVLTREQSELVRRQQLAMKSYPAQVQAPGLGGAYLCAACADACEELVEKDDEGKPAYTPVGDTGGVPIPCTFHVHPERLPEGVGEDYQRGVYAAMGLPAPEASTCEPAAT